MAAAGSSYPSLRFTPLTSVPSGKYLFPSACTDPSNWLIGVVGPLAGEAGEAEEAGASGAAGAAGATGAAGSS